MKRNLVAILSVWLPLAFSAVAAGDRSAPVRQQNLDRSFQVLEKRDIFDSHRAPKPPPPKQEQLDSFTLNGAMTYGANKHAFFEGYGASGSRRAFGVGETINGFRIVEITNDAAKLAAPDGQMVFLAVGSRMLRVDNGPWEPAATADQDVKEKLERRRQEMQQP
jgi:hypothetical protein